MRDSQSSVATRVPLATWICVGLPYLGLFVFVTMALHVRLSFGRWPMDAIESKDMTPGMHLHDLIFTMTFLLGAFAAGPLWLITLCFRKLRISASVHVVQAVILRLGLFVIWAGPFELFPAEWVVWFLD